MLIIIQLFVKSFRRLPWPQDDNRRGLADTWPMKLVAQNRRARFDYDILATFEAGIVLKGWEVKSCRGGHVNLAGSYVSFHGGVPVLKNAKIAPYAFAVKPSLDEIQRDRPLLLRASELTKLESAAGEKGNTVVPLQMRAGRFIKVTLGVGRGRKKLDKRQRIKEREIGRKLREGKEW